MFNLNSSLSPEEKAKRIQTNKKIFLVGCLPLGLLLVILLFFSHEDSPSSQSETETYTLKEEDIRFIPGLFPVDVYLNMENQGFSTKTTIGDISTGTLWENKKQIYGINFIVQTYSRSSNKVESVRAIAMVNPEIKNIVATKQFLQMVSTIPYKGSNPKFAAQWVAQNFYKHKASINIGGVVFTILAPSNASRTLYIEVEQA